jgi:predicted Zn-ribbon and HTH transcriptional regulator
MKTLTEAEYDAAISAAEVFPAGRSYKQHRSKDPEKNNAREKLHYAVKTGEVIKPGTCQQCGQTFSREKLHAHHADYSRPLDVEWLCESCHSLNHHGAIEPREPLRSKLPQINWDAVREIRRLSASGTPHYLIAEQFNVSRPTITDIVRGRTWKEDGKS